MCPACKVHTVPEPLERQDGGWSAFTRPCRCPICGGVWRSCDWKILDERERAEAQERRRERKREWHKAHPDYYRDWYACNRDRACAAMRDRYAADPEFRQSRLEYNRRYRRENIDAVRAYQRQYAQSHRKETAVRQKRWRLRKLREEKGSE